MEEPYKDISQADNFWLMLHHLSNQLNDPESTETIKSLCQGKIVGGFLNNSKKTTRDIFNKLKEQGDISVSNLEYLTDKILKQMKKTELIKAVNDWKRKSTQQDTSTGAMGGSTGGGQGTPPNVHIEGVHAPGMQVQGNVAAGRDHMTVNFGGQNPVPAPAPVKPAQTFGGGVAAPPTGHWQTDQSSGNQREQPGGAGGPSSVTIVYGDQVNMKKGDYKPRGNRVNFKGDGNTVATGGRDSHATSHPVDRIDEQLNQQLKKVTEEFIEKIKDSEKTATDEQRVQRALKSTNFEKAFDCNVRVTHLEELIRLSQSVGIIRVENGTSGSGFRLGQRFFLTNLHVIESMLKNLYDPAGWLEREPIQNLDLTPANIEVSFDYKKILKNATFIKCIRIVSFSNNLDYCLLELEYSCTLPEGLGHLVPDDGPRFGIDYLSIIGHPYGDAKSVDARCRIGDETDREKIFTLGSTAPPSQTDTESYETSMKWGSSGSPVFTNKGDLVAIHTIGSKYLPQYQPGAGKQFIIEHGYSMYTIRNDLKSSLPDDLFENLFL